MEQAIHVCSEIGRLRKVLLHRPGGELENLMPEYLERLLFDDIPYLEEARREHDAFADCLRKAGVEVLYLTDLVAESFTSPEIRQRFISEFLTEGGVTEERQRRALEDFLAPLGDKALVEQCMAGIRKSQLRRGGRLSAGKAIVGNLLNIKPVLHVDDEGHLVPMASAKGRKKSIEALVSHMEESAVAPEQQRVYISHGDCLADAQLLAQMVRDRLHVSSVTIGDVGPVIGAHSGAGTLALFFVGTHR